MTGRNADGIQDASCAAENIQLAATSFGLGATWINALMTICDEPEIREKLDQYQIPKTHNVWAMIAVGWPEAPARPWPARPTWSTSWTDPFILSCTEVMK